MLQIEHSFYFLSSPFGRAGVTAAVQGSACMCGVVIIALVSKVIVLVTSRYAAFRVC